MTKLVWMKTDINIYIIDRYNLYIIDIYNIYIIDRYNIYIIDTYNVSHRRKEWDTFVNIVLAALD